MSIIIVGLVVLLIIVGFVIKHVHDVKLAKVQQYNELVHLANTKNLLLEELNTLRTMTKINDSEFTLGKITEEEWQSKRTEILEQLAFLENKLK